MGGGDRYRSLRSARLGSDRRPAMWTHLSLGLLLAVAATATTRTQAQSGQATQDQDRDRDRGRGRGVLVSLEELPSPQHTIINEGVIKNSRLRKKKKKWKRKGKEKRMDPMTVPENDASDDPSLDMSCLLNKFGDTPKFVRPPQVPNSIGPKFVRRKTEKQKYLIAIYRCVSGYKLHSPRSRSLGCQSGKWVGRLPICLPKKAKTRCINAGCEHDCRVVRGKPKCFCFNGFRQNGKSCIDINECNRKNGGCQSTCHNTHGSFYCGCEPGYRLATNHLSCVDINECLARNGHGPCQGQCNNMEGSYHCSCEGTPGTRLSEDGIGCEDIDECSDEGHLLGCSHSCINTLGTAFCLCPAGYELDTDWKTCRGASEPKGCEGLSDDDGTATVDCGSVLERYPEGTECRVGCRVGYKLVGSETKVCLVNGSWSGEYFYCEAQIRPYIRCLPGVRLNLPPGESSMAVTIPQPMSNVDWAKYVTSYPSWGKQLQASLPFGTTRVQFVATSPTSTYVAKCDITVQVKDVEKPTITGCPDDIRITQKPDQRAATVTVDWTEPTVTDNVHVAHVFQSKRSGVSLGEGLHLVNYIAADSSGNIAQCQFTITIGDVNELGNNP